MRTVLTIALAFALQAPVLSVAAPSALLGLETPPVPAGCAEKEGGDNPDGDF